MAIIIFLNIIVLLVSLLWVAFEPGFEPIIVTLTCIVTLIGLSIKSANTKALKDNVPVKTNPTVNSKSQLTEVELVASRFREILELMNKGNDYSPYTIAKLAQLMGLSTTGELERIFKAEEEPPFTFINKFTEHFGVNKDWLIHGQKHPYTNDDWSSLDPTDYFSEIEQLEPEDIYFILNKTDVGETFILLKLSEFKYKIFQQTWHVSSHVGGGGRQQIFGLYKLIRKLKDTGLASKCHGRILEANIFENLLVGDSFPETILQRPSFNNPWWDDFTDIYGKYAISKNYKEWYGRGFTFAQKVVREKLGDDGLTDKRLHTVNKQGLDEYIRDMENESS